MLNFDPRLSQLIGSTLALEYMRAGEHSQPIATEYSLILLQNMLRRLALRH